MSDKELLNIGTTVRNTEPKIANNGNRIYQYYNEAGDIFRVIVGNKKDGERIVSFYSNRKAGLGNDSQHYIYNQPLDAKSVQQVIPQSQDIAFSRDVKTPFNVPNQRAL